MTITVVQSVTQVDTNIGGMNITIGATTAGNALLVATMHRSTSSGGAGNVDASLASGTFVKQIDHQYGYNRGNLFYATNVAGGLTNVSISIAGGNVAKFRALVVEVSGISGTPTVNYGVEVGADTSPFVASWLVGPAVVVAFLARSTSSLVNITGLTSGWTATQDDARVVALRNNVATDEYVSFAGSLSPSSNWHGGILALTSGVVSVSDADTCSGSDASSGVVQSKSDTETGSGSDAGSLLAESTGSDTSASADTEALSASLTDADTAFGVDDGLADADLSDGDTAPSTEEGWLTDRPVSGSDTATGTDAGTLSVAVSSSDTASAVDETSVRGFGDTETALAVEDGTVLAAIADADTASDVEAESPIGITDSDAASAAAADAVSFLDYTYRFNPPGTEGYRDPKHPLFRRIPHVVGVTVLKIGGTYRQIENPEDTDFAAATEVYIGGHDTTVHQTTADALTAAGYGAYLTRF